MKGSWLRAAGVIGLSTLVEAVRNRILLVAVAFALVLVGASVAAASVSFAERGRMIVDVGLAAASGLGALIAVALAVSTFAGEIRKHTAYPVLVRPIPRHAFILGKYLGVLATMVLVVTIMIGATALTVLVYGEELPTALAAALWLNWLEMAVVIGVGFAFSTLASPALAATYSAGFVIAGNLAGDVQAFASRLMDKGKVLGRVLEAAYYVIPDLQNLSVRTQAANMMPVPSGFTATGTLYGLSYAAAVVVLAMWIFSRRESI